MAVPQSRPKRSAGGSELSTLQILAFGGCVWPLVIGQQSLTYMLPYYSQVIGLSIVAIGGIFTAGRVFDAVWDTGIAFISDNTRSRWGRRKPWIVLGLVLFLPAIWWLFVPGHHATLAGYTLALFFFFFAWTMAYIPLLSQATEISDDYVVRNNVSLTQSVFTVTAILIGSLIPFLLLDQRTAGLREATAAGLTPLSSVFGPFIHFLQQPTITGPERFGPLMLVTVVVTSIGLPISLLSYVFLVREKPVKAYAPKGSVTAALRNPVFQRFFSAYGLMMLGYMGRQGLVPFIIIFTLKATDDVLFFVMLSYVTSVLCTPIWSFLLKRMERVNIVILSGLIEVAGLVALGIAGPGDRWLQIAAFVVIGIPGLTIMLIPYQIAGDCADYAKWKTGTESRAVHVSLISLTKKVGSIWAAAMVAIAGLMGFNPKIPEASTFIIRVIEVLGIYLPALLLLIGCIGLIGFPMTQRRHRALRGRIDRRAEAGATVT